MSFYNQIVFRAPDSYNSNVSVQVNIDATIRWVGLTPMGLKDEPSDQSQQLTHSEILNINFFEVEPSTIET